MCVHVHVCGDTPMPPDAPHPPAPSPEPQGAQNTERFQNTVLLASTQAVYKAPHSTVQEQ